jgi:hypothetical protein
METPRNEFLWRKAKKRAGFKSHLQSYLLVNAGLWLLYSVLAARVSGYSMYPWPIWPMFGWGIGLVSHYLSVYGNNTQGATQREYEKLLREQH